jgi:hypothetical protein
MSQPKNKGTALGHAVYASDAIVTAVVEDISPDGVPLVVLSGDVQTREASSVLHYPSAAAAAEALLGRTVLVLVKELTTPVILGVVAERLWDSRDGEPALAQGRLPANAPRVAQLDKRRLEFEATEEIRLTCGKSSLLLRRDGTVIVKGVKIVSRALESNKIRGGTVNIN